MKKSKRKLISGLIRILLAAATIFPSKAQERLVISLSSQSNDTTLTYYGSGDIDNNNILNWNDYNLMQSGTQNDMSDINGDGVSSSLQDQQILQNYLNQITNNLPSNWNKLDSLKKVNWLEKMLQIDKTDTIISTNCYDFSNPEVINLNGFPSLANGVGPNFPWKFSKNGRFNIPACTVSTTTRLGSAHSLVGVLVGDDPFNFYHWYFIDPSSDNQITPGHVYMANNKNVEINYYPDMDPETGGDIGGVKIIKWNLDENGSPTLLYTHYLKHIIPTNPNKDTIAPETTLSVSDSTYSNSDINLEYLVEENQTFLDSAYYKLNGVKTNIACEVYATPIISAPVDSISGTLPTISQEGEYNLVFFANDMAKPQGNETILKRYFVIDKIPPTTSDNISTTWQNSDFEVVLNPSDELSGVVSTKYCISSTNNCTPNIEYTSPVSISEEGEKYFRYFSTDKAGNNQNIVSKEIKLDKTAPEITASISHIEGTDSAEVAINVLEANLDSARYSYNGSDWNYFSSDTLFREELKEGENVLNVEARDKATNFSEIEEKLNFVPDAVEPSKTLENYFKVYPNPVSNIGNFEFYLDAPKNLKFSVYDVSGRELEKIIVEGNQGDNKLNYDFSKYKSGIYIYKLGTKTGKIVKE